MKIHSRAGFNPSLFLSLIRALFPYWSFFDRVGHQFELEFKVPNSKTWEPLSFGQVRSRLCFLFNANCNEAMAQVNIIEHFARDIQELQNINPAVHSRDVQNLTTFRLLKSLLKVKIQDYGLESKTIQFKILAESPNEKVVVYISDWISLESV